MNELDYVRSTVRQVPDFPKPGILFLDITTATKDAKAMNLMIDFLVEKIKSQACYLLCSDGFRHEIEGEEIYFYCNPRKCKTQEDMYEQLKRLTERNKQRGERDNISSILLQVGRESC